jgi:hypothetical protein
MAERDVAVFFYGLFMDESLLDSKGMDGTREPATCYLLPADKLEGTNPQYVNALLALAGKLNLPSSHLELIRRQARRTEPT